MGQFTLKKIKECSRCYWHSHLQCIGIHQQMTPFLPAATKLDQGNIFTSVCQEFCPQGGRVSASVHAGIHTTPPTRQTPPPPGADTPQTRQTSSGADTPPPSPQTRQTPPGVDTPSPLPPTRQTPPPTRQTNPPRTRQTPPPQKQTPAHGLRAAGTHPTGMHSCSV